MTSKFEFTVNLSHKYFPPTLSGRGFKHQGPNKSLKFGNTTLEVRKIPPDMNNIAKLNEHFGKFGTLTNIQVSFFVVILQKSMLVLIFR